MERKLYNSQIIAAYIELLEYKYREIKIDLLLERCNMVRYELQDESHWFSQREVNHFYESLLTLARETYRGKKLEKFIENIAEEAGVHSNKIYRLRFDFLRNSNPSYIFKLADNFAARLTRASIYKVKPLSLNRVQVTVEPKPGIEEEAFQCENRKGFLRAIPEGAGYRVVDFRELGCRYKGGHVCQYEIAWKQKIPLSIKMISLGFAGSIAVAFWFVSRGFLNLWQGGVMLLPLWLFLGAWFFGSRSRRASFDPDNEALLSLLDSDYQTALIYNEVGAILNQVRAENEEVEKIIAQVLEDRLSYDRGAILLANEPRNRLIYKGGFGYSREELELWTTESGFHLDNSSSRGPLVKAFKEQKPILIDNVNSFKDTLSHRSRNLVASLKTRAFVCCPIVYNKESLGVIVFDNVKTNRPLLARDMNLIKGLAFQVGAYLNSLKEQREHESQKLEAQKDMARKAAHNISNPAAGISFSLNTALKDPALTPETRKALERSVQFLNRIQRLTSEFLKHNKPLKLRLGWENVRKLLEEILPYYEDKIELRYTIAEGVENLYIDRENIRWVLDEMITNAVKAKARRITLEFTGKEGQCRLRVCDDGEGIPETFRKKLFVLFESSDKLGYGIGMATIKKIIDEHKGSITADFSYTPGACFIIKLPLGAERMKDE